MSIDGDLYKDCALYAAWVRGFENDITRVARAEWKNELPNVFSDFTTIVKHEVKNAFNDAIRSWYDSYPTKIYKRRGSNGSGGLFDLLKDEVEMASGNDGERVYRADYDEGKMHGLRSGGGNEYLYDLVFKRGYHGGAPDESGTYRYRRPVGKWYAWSRQAVQTEAPETLADTAIKKVMSGTLVSRFDKIVRTHAESAATKTIDQYMTEILSRV